MDDYKIVKASKMLFARKFDPYHNSSMELVKNIEIWREESQKTEELNDFTGPMQAEFMLRVAHKDNLVMFDKLIEPQNTHSNMLNEIHRKLYASNDNSRATEDVCVSSVGELADKLILQRCNASNPLQWFTLGKWV